MENNFNILCIDDDPNILDILTEQLSSYDLFMTTDPYEGLEILLQNSIDLILLDISMPKLNGFSVCKMIKNEKELEDIPIIFITASTDDKDIQEAFSSGGVDYIKKPINIMELKVRVKNHLNLRNYQLQLQQDVQKEIEKNTKTEQILLHRSEILHAVKLYLSKQADKPLAKNDFQRVIQDSMELLKSEQSKAVIELDENYKWHSSDSTLYCNESIVKLKASEANLLELFILKKNQKISIEQIHFYLWGDSSLTFNATSVRNLITGLRKKLPKKFITTVYGGEYVFHFTFNDSCFESSIS